LSQPVKHVDEIHVDEIQFDEIALDKMLFVNILTGSERRLDNH
jgi:hypothetical protein